MTRRNVRRKQQKKSRGKRHWKGGREGWEEENGRKTRVWRHGGNNTPWMEVKCQIEELREKRMERMGGRE